jgi:DNA polymerase elongation subunit (family B)
MTARGNLFDRTHKGLIPTIVEKFYNERSVIKKKMLKAQQKLVDHGKSTEIIDEELKKFDQTDRLTASLMPNGNTNSLIQEKDETVQQPNKKYLKYQYEKEIATYGNQQMAIKILMNSLYGATSNEYFRYFDQRIAESITMSGQLTIRWAENKINEFMNKTMKTDNQDYVVAIDTDSLYIRMGDLVKKINPSDPVKFLDKVATQKIEPLLAESYEELKEYMNCAEQKMVMAREVIAERGIWTGKKHYVLNVWNNEGVQYEEPQLKVQGIEAVRSSTPAVCRDLIKSTIKKILTSDETTIQKIIAQEKKNFRELEVEDVAFPRSANNLDKYVDGSLIYRKGTPIHIRASLLHNYHIDKMKLGNKYEKIYSGEKIKFVYLRKPNRLYENVVAFKNILPQEFNIRDHIDYDLQFEKAFVEPIKTILDAIGWQVEKRATLEDFWI